MTICECKNKCNCTLFAVIVSLAVGIVTVFLNFSATLIVPQTLLWAFLGAAIVFLFIGMLASFVERNWQNTQCLCDAVEEFIFGSLATVFFSVVLLAVDISSTSLLASILVGALFGAFSLVLTGTSCIIKYKLKCKD